MRIVSWNMAGGFAFDPAQHERAWAWVRDYPADVFLLQEVVPPGWLTEGVFATVHYREKVNHSSTKWGSGVFARSPGWLTYEPVETLPWLGALAGSCAIARPGIAGLPWLASLHPNAKRMDPAVISNADVTDVVRCDDDDWWEVDLIAHSLSRLLSGQSFVVGGDLNSSLMLDSGAKLSNARLFANLREGGFIDLRTPPHPEPEPPTYFKTGTRPMQLDYLMADPTTASGATGWTVLSEVVTELGLSDHAPVQIDVQVGASR